MKSSSILAILLLFAGSNAPAQQPRVYYDYVENGQLTGGRFVVDPTDAEQRRMFNLDGDIAVVAGGWPVTTVVDNGPVENRIDIVILGDGYTSPQLGSYAVHTQNVVNAFFAQEPFAAYASYFNVHRVDVTSAQSGVDEIDLGIFRNTALDMAYGCFGIDRLLCINVAKAANAASSENTLGIMAIIAFLGLPFVMSYTAVIYWVFRGKVEVGKFSY